MNHWKETADILSRLTELKAEGRRAALATVVRVVGSAYRRPGAKFLIEESGETLGSVSGGCLEADVREIAKEVLATGIPRLRSYSTGTDDDVVWGLGLGCNGSVDVFIQKATEGSLSDVEERVRALLAGDEAFLLATALDGDAAGDLLLLDPKGDHEGSLGSATLDGWAGEQAGSLLASGRSAVKILGERRVFFEVLPPPPHLIVCGAGDDARPLVAYASDAGFRVTVVDHRPGLMEPAWFPQAVRLAVARPEDPLELPPAARCFAVVKSHSLAKDREWVKRLLAAGLPYVGVLGPRARTESIFEEIGWPDEGRVFGPVGLDIGADGPRQVALSIVAELLAFVAGREPRHLSERKGAIHAV